MNRALLLAAAAVAALSLAACNKKPSTEANTAAGNSAMAVNPGQSAPVNAAQDTMAAAVGQTSAATLGAHDTGAFVESATQGNMYEIQAAHIAEQRSKSADVKAFAKKMIIDHTALANTMKPLITKAGKTPAADVGQRLKGMLDNLNAASPQDFDKTYIDQQVAAHEETLTLLQGYSEHGDDPGLKAAAAKTVPMVQDHLDRAKAIQAKLSSATK